MKLFCQVLFFSIIIFDYSLHATETPRRINWDNLLPKLPPLSDPFTSLSRTQLLDLEFLISTHKMQQKGEISDVHRMSEEAIEIKHKLKREGLNVVRLMEVFENWEQEILRRDQIANEELNAKFIKIPGFALPLEHSESGVKELLLVPYVGACIHAPPPPANQTIYVKLQDAKIFKNIYEPVWIIGRISVKKMRKTLGFVDGSADIQMTYFIDGLQVLAYSD